VFLCRFRKCIGCGIAMLAAELHLSCGIAVVPSVCTKTSLAAWNEPENDLISEMECNEWTDGMK